MIASPDSATITDLGGGNRILSLTPPVGLDYQELPANIDSDITLEISFGANDEDSTYLGPRENPPAIENTTPNLSAIIKDVGNILKVFDKGISKLNAPRALFTQDNELVPTELVEGEATQTKATLANGEMTTLLTQHPS